MRNKSLSNKKVYVGWDIGGANIKIVVLYENLNFIYDRKDSIDDSFSALHKVHYNITPVHKKYVLSIKGSVPAQKNQKQET